MPRFLVVDFETTGIGMDNANGYKEYAIDKRSLPRKNFPVELAAVIIENNEIV